MLNSDSLKFCPPLPWIAAPGCLLVHFVNVWWPGRAPLSLCLPLPTWIFAIWGQFIFCPEEIVDLCYNVKKLKIKAVIVMMMMLMFLMMLMMMMMMMMIPLLLNWRWPPPPPFPHIGMQMRCVPGDPTMVTSTAFAAFRQNLAKRRLWWMMGAGATKHEYQPPAAPELNHPKASSWMYCSQLYCTTAIAGYCGFCSNRILHYFRLSVCPCVCVSQAWHLSFLTYKKA